MRDNTIEAFFALVRAGLWETEVRLASYGEVDFETILRIAREQSIVGLVAAGLEHVVDVKMPQKWALQFASETIQLEQRNMAMNMYIAELIDEMKSENIYTLLVKGQGLAQCYERPLWRACGDVDLLLSRDKYEIAKSFIMQKGVLTEPEEMGKKHLAMQVGQWSVELHGTLHVGLCVRVDKMIDNVQSDIIGGGHVRSWINGQTQVFLPAANEDAVYVFAHILQHFYKGGIGLRQICDWCRLLYTYRDELNFGYLKSRIEEARLMSEWKAFGAFAVDYLGMLASAMPFYCSSKKWPRKANRICDFVLEVGNLGHNRDMSYFQKGNYLKKKIISLRRRCVDVFRHMSIFPLDSIRFFGGLVLNGARSVLNGE